MKKRIQSIIMTIILIISIFAVSTVKAASMKFNDVQPGSWFYEAVQFVFERGMIKGYTDTKFAPDDKLTRGQLVTIFYRLEKEPSVAGVNCTFTDIGTNEYYTNAVKWANKNGIVTGYSAKSFGPNDPITRQDLAVIINRHAKYKDKKYEAKGNLNAFKDKNKVADYAKAAVTWTVDYGIIKGNPQSDGSKTIAPISNATRAEVAVMLMRYLKADLDKVNYTVDEEKKEQYKNEFKNAELERDATSDFSVGDVYSYNEDLYDVIYESSNPDIATVDSDGNVTAKGLGEVTISCKLVDKETGEVIDETSGTINIVESTENLIQQEDELIDELDQKYWYLDGNEYAYIYFEETDDGLVVKTFGLESDDEGNVIVPDEWNWSTDEELKDKLSEDKDALGIKLVKDYDMYVEDNKLHVNIDGKDYVFTGDTVERWKEDCKPVFKKHEITVSTDEVEKVIEFEKRPYFYDYHLSAVISGDGMYAYNHTNVVDWLFSSKDSNIKVKPVRPGTVYITVRNDENGLSDTIKVNIIEGNRTDIEYIWVGDYYYQTEKIESKSVLNEYSDQYSPLNNLDVKVYPYSSQNSSLIYTSSNPEVVIVSSTGQYTAYKPGEATITISTADGSVKKEIQFKTLEKPLEAKVDIEGGKGGNGFLYCAVYPSYGTYEYNIEEYSIFVNDEEYKDTVFFEGDRYIKIKYTPGKYKFTAKVVDSNGCEIVVEKEMYID